MARPGFLLFLPSVLAMLFGIDIWQLLKFGVTGVAGFIIDFGVTFLLKEKLKVHKYIANSVAFILAATNNYFLNRSWTFENTDPDMTGQYITFMIVSTGGLLVNNGTIWLLNDKGRMNFWLAKFLAVFVSMIWNFIGYKFFTFNTH